MSGCSECAGKQRQSTYFKLCLTCCARMIIHARPSKEMQEKEFASIERVKGSPTRAAILEKVKELGND